MNKLKDFTCTYGNAVGVSAQVTGRLGLTFPDAYLHADSMAALAKTIQEEENACFCLLPLCHTVEAEAVGGSVNYGDANTGPRAKDFVCATAEDVLALPPIDFTRGRITQVLQACKLLLAQGEEVVLMISGPFTILGVLMDTLPAAKLLRKRPDAMMQILDKLRAELVRFAREAQRAGVRLLCYADPTGGVNMLGPKSAAWVAEVFTVPLLRELDQSLGEDAMVLLCPKTALTLVGTEMARWTDVPLDRPMGYGEACIASVGKTRFAGQTCIKNIGYTLESGILQGLALSR